ncbi:hypothetical protein [Luteolibacter sp. AS25]|uniref:hypothetical protein n=1 Tax=Luteolibacter sp. AS25 TaxID=3135776 RepID=UPI00398A7384
MRWLLLIPLLYGTNLSAEPVYTAEKEIRRNLSPDVTEASGLAVSPTNPNFLWIINDSGNGNTVHLTGIEGEDRGAITIKGVRNRDWEDLAAFTLNGLPYLLIADTGDNSSRRSSVFLYIIREPKLPAAGKAIQGESQIAWSMEFTFEGGPRDCEAVAVDVKAGKILLLTKRTTPPELHELPLRPAGKGLQVTKKIGTMRTIAPVFRLLPYGNQPTGMDISADGLLMAINTYSGVFLLSRDKTIDWQEASMRQPNWLGVHQLAQAESIAISPDKKTIFLTSEGKKQPLVRFVSGK